MRRTSLLMIGGMAVVMAAAIVPLSASDPMGVYCLVQKVVMAPDELHPTTVQVSGACSMTDGEMGGGYGAPVKGYLYYSAPAGKGDVALREWADLKKAAATGDIVGFGGRYMRMGRLRPANEAPKDPDVYPIQMGVIRIADNRNAIDSRTVTYSDLIAALKRVAGAR